MNTAELNSDRQDRRHCRKFVNSAFARTGRPTFSFSLQPRRARAHFILHQGTGAESGFASSSMGAAAWNNLRDQIIDAGRLVVKGGAS